MNIDHIATSLIDRANHSPGDVPLDHPYRQRWWLPIIGPSATCILDHLATSDESPSSWKVTPALELATAIGLGKGTGRNSPLIRSIDRLTRFGFGHWDVEPGPACDPCISIYRTVRLVPQHLAAKWPTALQQAHAVDLADIYRKASLRGTR